MDHMDIIQPLLTTNHGLVMSSIAPHTAGDPTFIISAQLRPCLQQLLDHLRVAVQRRAVQRAVPVAPRPLPQRRNGANAERRIRRRQELMNLATGHGHLVELNN